jgi:hypothetical protein
LITICTESLSGTANGSLIRGRSERTTSSSSIADKPDEHGDAVAEQDGDAVFAEAKGQRAGVNRIRPLEAAGLQALAEQQRSGRKGVRRGHGGIEGRSR